jgi:ribosomal protein S18 acetylase RimI-like enzyme
MNIETLPESENPDKRFRGIVRPLKENDLTDLKRILEIWLRDSREGKLLPEEVKTDMDYLKDSLKEWGGRRYIVAEDLEGAVVGMMGLSEIKEELRPFVQTKKPIELVNAYVDNDYRGGKGVGTALINTLQEMARDAGSTEILLESGPRYKLTGHEFYDKQPGFERVGILTNFYGLNGDSIVWRKQL